MGLMGQDVPPGEGSHNPGSPELLRMRQRAITGVTVRWAVDGASGITGNCGGNQAWMTSASFGLPAASIR